MESNDSRKSPEPCVGGAYLRHLLEKNAAFEKLMHLETPLAIARLVLGPQVQFDELAGRISNLASDNPEITWHIHHRVLTTPQPPFFSYPHGINCLLYLDDVDMARGPLCVLPGSHLSDQAPSAKDSSDKRGQKVLTVTAGDAVLIHANLWHRSLPSLIRFGSRRLLILGYLPAWFKTEEKSNYTPRPYVRQRLKANDDIEVRELAGEFFWG